MSGDDDASAFLWLVWLDFEYVLIQLFEFGQMDVAPNECGGVI